MFCVHNLCNSLVQTIRAITQPIMESIQAIVTAALSCFDTLADSSTANHGAYKLIIMKCVTGTLCRHAGLIQQT
jgi:hypothetical protein